MEKKTYTSQNFVRRPLASFRSAYDGCKTIINHAQYPEGVFELTYRKREACFSHEPISGEFTIKNSNDPKYKHGDKIQFTNTMANDLPDVPVSIPSALDKIQHLIRVGKHAPTDAQKDLMIKDLPYWANQGGLKCTLIDGLPGYAILSEDNPNLIRGPIFRWINYEMRSGFAETFEECVAKARAHAAKNDD